MKKLLQIACASWLGTRSPCGRAEEETPARAKSSSGTATRSATTPRKLASSPSGARRRSPSRTRSCAPPARRRSPSNRSGQGVPRLRLELVRLVSGRRRHRHRRLQEPPVLGPSSTRKPTISNVTLVSSDKQKKASEGAACSIPSRPGGRQMAPGHDPDRQAGHEAGPQPRQGLGSDVRQLVAGSGQLHALHRRDRVRRQGGTHHSAGGRDHDAVAESRGGERSEDPLRRPLGRRGSSGRRARGRTAW